MRTFMILSAGLLMLAAWLIFSRLFTEHFPGASTVAVGAFLILWLLGTGFNLWVGVTKAGYTVGEELPVMLLLFGVPAAVAILIQWKWH